MNRALFFGILFVLFGTLGCAQPLEQKDTTYAYDGTPLTPLQHSVLWQAGTERAFSNEYFDEHAEGLYVTRGCGIPVFTSKTKYDSHTGWPSFWQPLSENAVSLQTDYALGIERTEVQSNCGEHLGHVFNDGPAPTGKRYCMNSAALVFIPYANLTSEQRALYDADNSTAAASPVGAN